MMSLAQRVRDFRYSKGWGPDELASRAEISRTALYQIESGKTGLPRAGTLRRIAVALEISMDDLLGHPDLTSQSSTRSSNDPSHAASRMHDFRTWIPAEGGPLNIPPSNSHLSNHHQVSLAEPRVEETRFGMEGQRRKGTAGVENLVVREGELMSKLHDLLHSSLGTGIARIVDELHLVVTRNRNLP
jgi:transcriptional regulator with XRE-family HTH domain